MNKNYKFDINALKSTALSQFRSGNSLFGKDGANGQIRTKLHLFIKPLFGCIFLFATAHATVKIDEVFSSHMVLQRNAPIHIWGKSSGEENITVRFGNMKRKTRSKDLQWEVVFDALPEGGPYTLTVSADNRIVLTDILIGDVWICAGQSNMRLRVKEAYNADLAILKAHSDQLRLSDWEGSLYPNNIPYPLPFLRALTPENYYTNKQWQRSDSASVSHFSAVGYYFGKQLQEALQIPIGLVNNSIGGVPVETYIPAEMLKADSLLHPLTESGWLSHPLYPVWTAERVHQNLAAWKEAGSIPPMPLHPYQPGFLYEAGIQPLHHLSFKGIIWYQGESNATFTADSTAMDADLNKYKLQLLIRSLRTSLHHPELPFIMIQLPALNRDWKSYREVQLELAKEMTGVSLVVTLDLGNSFDVHPKEKQIVGERAARAALADVYQKKITAGSPLFRSCRTEGKYLIVSFYNSSNGLKTSDGEALREIEIKDAQGTAWPAKVIFKSGELWIFADQVSSPVSAQYAWKNNPNRANLCNAEGLPASPFNTAFHSK